MSKNIREKIVICIQIHKGNYAGYPKYKYLKMALHPIRKKKGGGMECCSLDHGNFRPKQNTWSCA